MSRLTKKDILNMSYLKLWEQEKITEAKFWECVDTSHKKSNKRKLKYIKKLIKKMKEFKDEHNTSH